MSINRLESSKNEVCTTYRINCNARSFRQYLLDAGTLQVGVRIGGGDDNEVHNQAPETPRHRLMRR